MKVTNSSQSVGESGRDGARFSPFISARQTAFQTSFTCRMKFDPAGKESAGLALTQAINNAIVLEKFRDGEETKIRFMLVTTSYDGAPYFPNFTFTTEKTEIASAPCSEEWTELCLAIDGTRVTASVNGTVIGETDSTALFPDAKSGGMVGTMIGMFATGNGQESDQEAQFDWFEIR